MLSPAPPAPAAAGPETAPIPQGESRLRAIFEAVPAAVLATDGHGTLVYFNPAAEALFGWTAAEVLGRSVESLMPERYRAAHRAGMARVMATGEHRTAGRPLELEALHRDGREFPIELALGIAEDGGRPVFTAVVHEVSGRTAAQQQLRAAEERFAQAFGGAAMGIALVATDGRFVRANRALVELSGHSERELGELRLGDLLHPGDRPPMLGALRALAAGRTDRYVGEHRWLRRDGEVMHLRSHAGAVRDGAGDTRHLVVTLEDVTERRRMLEALTLSESRYRALVEHLPDTVITLFDEDLRMLVVEGSGLDRLARTPAELEGRRLSEVLGPSHMARIEPHYRAALAGETRSFDAASDAETTWWIQASPMHDEAGRVIGGMAVWRDVSARKAVERALAARNVELERSNGELEQFAYVASHDLAEPLRMVTSYLQLLERRYHGRLGEDADEFIHFAVDGATRMRQLIDDLLAYSRAGRSDRPTERVDTAALVDRVTEVLLAGREEQATIERQHLPTIDGDPRQLEQLFQNLLGNALKFMPPGRAPEVRVSAEETPGAWVFTVADNGIGLDPGHAERIFRMFQRLHGRDEYPGTGVGLAIARKVVDRHSGRIWAEPAPGGGAAFRFELPRRR